MFYMHVFMRFFGTIKDDGCDNI